MAERDPVKVAARNAVNLAIRRGDLRRPNSLPCTDCGHRWAEGQRRHEYDHPRGYDADHMFDVEPVCTECHAKRDSSKLAQVSCIHGHPFTEENTILRSNGTRHCRECKRAHDRGRRDAAWWRAYRAAKRAVHG